MILEIDFNSDEAIYVQLRNQIVKGIGKGELKAGEKLPTVRPLWESHVQNLLMENHFHLSVS